MTHQASFLQSKDPAYSTQSRTRRLKWVIGAAVFVFAGYLAVCIVSGIEVWMHVDEARGHVEEAKTSSKKLRFIETEQALMQARVSLEGARGYAAVLKSAAFVPVIGASVSQSSTLIQAGIDVIDATQQVVTVGADAVRLSGVDEQMIGQETASAPTFTDLSAETRGLILRRLQSASKTFSLLAHRLALVEDDVRRHVPAKGVLQEPIEAFVQELESAQTTLQYIGLMTDVLPAFAGVSEPADHLLLLLNNTELRPGGGFLGNIGSMRVVDGSIEDVKIADIYAFDGPAAHALTEAAPYPIAQYMQTPISYLRDVNWSPDFAVSTQAVISKYQQEIAAIPQEARATLPVIEHPQGVIGITPTAVEAILRFTGPIQAQGKTYSAETIADELEYQVEFGFAKQGIDVERRKDVVGALAQELVEKSKVWSMNDWVTVLGILRSQLDQRHIMVYHADPIIETSLVAAGWSGRMIPTQDADVQLVVEANLASLKTDPVVDRTVKYTIEKNAQGEWIGTTKITYQHKGTFDWKTTRYRTYTRLYVPQGSSLIRVEGALKNDKLHDPAGTPGVADVSSELGMSVFGAFISIEPGQTRTLTFTYRLADSVRRQIARGTYRLDVLKQNGALSRTLTLDLAFGKTLVSAVPGEPESLWGDDRYQYETIMDQDQHMIVRLAP